MFHILCSLFHVSGNLPWKIYLYTFAHVVAVLQARDEWVGEQTIQQPWEDCRICSCASCRGMRRVCDEFEERHQISYCWRSCFECRFPLNREESVKIIVDNLHDKDVVVATTGMLSRELFEYRVEKCQGHEKDFLCVGSMGHASMIALGISKKKKNRQVNGRFVCWCL